MQLKDVKEWKERIDTTERRIMESIKEKAFGAVDKYVNTTKNDTTNCNK